MATGGWQAIPFWVLGIVTFLVPAGLAVSELGNLWPGQGGVYIWSYRTMNDNWAFVGGFLSWVPVILNGASGPATVLQMLLLAFHAQHRHDPLGHLATGHPVGGRGHGAGQAGRQPEGDEHRLHRLRRAHRGDLLRRPGLRPAARRPLGDAVPRQRPDQAELRRQRLPVRHRAALPGRRRDAVQHGRRVPLGQEERHPDDPLRLDRAGGDLPAHHDRDDARAAHREDQLRHGRHRQPRHLAAVGRHGGLRRGARGHRLHRPGRPTRSPTPGSSSSPGSSGTCPASSPTSTRAPATPSPRS